MFFSDGCTFVVVRDVEIVACFSFICSKIIFLSIKSMKDMKHLLFKLQLFLVLLVFTAVSAYAQKSPVDMDRFIDDLMNLNSATL